MKLKKCKINVRFKFVPVCVTIVTLYSEYDGI